MRASVFFAAVGLAILAAPVTVQAQGIVRGAEQGAAVGNRAAGPIGGTLFVELPEVSLAASKACSAFLRTPAPSGGSTDTRRREPFTLRNLSTHRKRFNPEPFIGEPIAVIGPAPRRDEIRSSSVPS
jgi:hypothetical protein